MDVCELRNGNKMGNQYFNLRCDIWIVGQSVVSCGLDILNLYKANKLLCCDTVYYSLNQV